MSSIDHRRSRRRLSYVLASIALTEMGFRSDVIERQLLAQGRRTARRPFALVLWQGWGR